MFKQIISNMFLSLGTHTNINKVFIGAELLGDYFIPRFIWTISIRYYKI